MITSADISRAARRIAPHIHRTGLELSEPMSKRTGARIAVKAEHRQRTGSFKLRGALNKVLGLGDDERSGGIVTASSGNHGLAVATAAGLADVACLVYLPANVSSSKRVAIESTGAGIALVESDDAYDAEVAARADAVEQGATYVPPYNDVAVIAGQGTIGLEIDAQAPAAGLSSIDAVVVAVGGGGLVSGIGSWLAEHRPSAIVVGASPGNDHAMLRAVAAGSVRSAIDAAAEPTFSDGTAGGVEPESITLGLCSSLVDEWLTVSEREIARAVASRIDDHGDLIEGAAGVALAAAEIWGAANPDASIVAISCGGNVSSASMRRMLLEADRQS